MESPLYFTAFEQLMHASAVLGECPRERLSLATVSVVSFWATALSAMLTNPIDVLRTRLMVPEPCLWSLCRPSTVASYFVVFMCFNY